MDRRNFLSLLGLTAASACTPVAGTREAVAERRSPPEQEVDSPRSGFQRIFWSVDTTEPAAAITFDDGPDPQFTPRILNVLAAYDVTATFMVMGHSALQHPELLREVVAAGHEIGGHGWRRLNLAEAKVPDVLREIEHGTRVIEDVAARSTRSRESRREPGRATRGRLASRTRSRCRAVTGQAVSRWPQ